MVFMEIAALIKCWERTPEQHKFNPPATEEELLSVEQELGSKLPQSLRFCAKLAGKFLSRS